LIFDKWAWVELNYRPHAYQATEGMQEVRQEIVKSLTDSVICRCSPFAMPDNVGFNRQLNRQQRGSSRSSPAMSASVAELLDVPSRRDDAVA